MQRFGSWLVFLVGLAALVGVVLWLRSGPAAAEPAPPRPAFWLPVTTGAVVRGELHPRVSLTGTVVAGKRSRMSFVVAGRIVSLAYDVGDEVQEGVELARIEDGDQQVALARAQAAVALAERQLDLLLAGSRAEEVRRLEADLEVARTAEVLAIKEVQRGEELLEQRILSAREFDVLLAERDASVGRVEAASQALALAQAGTRPEDLEVQRAELALRKAEEATARRELAKTVLRAPFDGSIVERGASLGDTVAAGETVFELAAGDERSVELEISSRFAASVTTPAALVLRLEEDPHFELRTELDALLFTADERTRNFRGRARLEPDEDRELRLRPGMFVRAELELAALRGALLVPRDAVRTVREGQVVVRALPAGGEADAETLEWTAEWVSVRVVGASGATVAVEALDADPPLAAGDTVVLAGVDLAFPGMAMRPSSRATSESRAAPEAPREEPVPGDASGDASGGAEAGS